MDLFCCFCRQKRGVSEETLVDTSEEQQDTNQSNSLFAKSDFNNDDVRQDSSSSASTGDASPKNNFSNMGQTSSNRHFDAVGSELVRYKQKEQKDILSRSLQQELVKLVDLPIAKSNILSSQFMMKIVTQNPMKICFEDNLYCDMSAHNEYATFDVMVTRKVEQIESAILENSSVANDYMPQLLNVQKTQSKTENSSAGSDYMPESNIKFPLHSDCKAKIKTGSSVSSASAENTFASTSSNVYISQQSQRNDIREHKNDMCVPIVRPQRSDSFQVLEVVNENAYIIDGKLQIGHCSWHCIIGNDDSTLSCQVCNTNFPKHDLDWHIKSSHHLKNLNKYPHEKTKEGHLIRQGVLQKRTHCSVCNRMMASHSFYYHVSARSHANSLQLANDLARTTLGNPNTILHVLKTPINELVVSQQTTEVPLGGNVAAEVKSSARKILTQQKNRMEENTNAQTINNSSVSETTKYVVHKIAITDSVLLDKMLNIPVDNWNCLIIEKNNRICVVCYFEKSKGDLCHFTKRNIKTHECFLKPSEARNHCESAKHRENLRKNSLLREHRQDLIRQLNRIWVHCAICNVVLGFGNVKKHCACKNHTSLRKRYTVLAEATLKTGIELKESETYTYAEVKDLSKAPIETSKNIASRSQSPVAPALPAKASQSIPRPADRLDKSGKHRAHLSKSDAATTNYQNKGDKYLQLTSVVRIKGKGLLVNDTVVCSQRGFNGFTGSAANPYCSACECSTERGGHLHFNLRTHQINMDKHGFLETYGHNLIRKLKANYHCALCGEVFIDADQHINEVKHHHKYVRCCSKARNIMKSSIL